MPTPIVQIYEIQTPEEARAVIECGADHVGSVITTMENRHVPTIRETVARVRQMGAVSSLIPLYTDTDAVLDTLVYYQPDLVHFCEQLDDAERVCVEKAITLQKAVRHHFPTIKITRAIPIGRSGNVDSDRVLALAKRFEPLSDFFLTDTVIGPESGNDADGLPVSGFVGITGLTCDWSVAARLVEQSRIPVILAGGIAPENVVEGIRQVRPYGVDSCTCTNAADANGRPIRFKKDLTRVRNLVAAVRGMAGTDKR
ncbi:N-(5'-phosphoribosyl)anthranilate isomerase [Desulfosarcina cetonica]|uniref:phosphoribosylanthranilate isomerase n=1 Tax=Desulfosarcina cetonica TaxID=90730 RepID=UPI0006D1FF19|nr:hypothetical protein [Desulfosarcina cetonica]VTR65235.1 N-(5'-phosphoribosyl)anthranilate isomerase [Desulfosarcina cetonica]